MLDQDSENVSWMQIYGLLGLYHRQFSIYKLALKQNDADLTELVNLEIFSILLSIHSMWIDVKMGDDLRNGVIKFVDDIYEYLVSTNDIPIGDNGYNGTKSCSELAQLIRLGLTSHYTGECHE